MFFLLVGPGGLMSFWRILRHIRVMFSTTTGVLMFTAIRNRLRAVQAEQRRKMSSHAQYPHRYTQHTQSNINVYSRSMQRKKEQLKIYKDKKKSLDILHTTA